MPLASASRAVSTSKTMIWCPPNHETSLAVGVSAPEGRTGVASERSLPRPLGRLTVSRADDTMATPNADTSPAMPSYIATHLLMPTVSSSTTGDDRYSSWPRSMTRKGLQVLILDVALLCNNPSVR
jgi:hypothetical protein